ncbi:Kazal-like serine protease inhibitor domain and phox-like domain-containing protein [Phytophthora sojae]|uniref:Kazal-like serine protease inhibitor domain and phox-like domain-containing protein n=1 Tax=Phytophthora sojae (strain P6497) TaxID=1094619 RepID=G4ZKB6_PHYSP|nr:Kazal-like serine protease inhibitor domain and phox-like domain-containing protein [Phytophthora sojae]EGZ15232.1 Kazal-like serine protease inhibitor domain and phox-like domain-containing protein [Phytophthora sojae]|eukprot:XP_009528981.1 Kazal-like serine protease inhibitor domain and phox-like domain-containing protein [Phytophthora sojae]
MLPVFVYPIFTAVFMSLKPTQQFWLSLLLPVMKRLLRHAFWLLLRQDPDISGAITCSVGHLYHVLFTAMCLQNAKSLETLAAVVVVNVFHMLLNCRDILKDANKVQKAKHELRAFDVAVADDIVSAALTLAQQEPLPELLHRKSPSRMFSNFPEFQGVYLLIVFWLPNRKYFATMTTMTTFFAVVKMIRHLLLLGIMEVVFLGLYLLLISRRLGVSGVLQLAFVLWSQRKLLQSKFLCLSVIILGFPLEHYGNSIIFNLRTAATPLEIGMGPQAAALIDCSKTLDCELVPYDPVCGSDGVTYANDCAFAAAFCSGESHTDTLFIQDVGECPPVTDDVEDQEGTPIMPLAELTPDEVCGTDGVTYINDCHLLASKCEHPELEKASHGECPTLEFNALEAARSESLPASTNNGGESCIPGPCPYTYAPVCGSDGQTHDNLCLFANARCQHPHNALAVVHDGECDADTKLTCETMTCPTFTECREQIEPDGAIVAYCADVCSPDRCSEREDCELVDSDCYTAPCSPIAMCIPKVLDG